METTLSISSTIDDLKTLLLIDIQHDFLPDGALAVNQGHAIFPYIERLVQQFDRVIATQDWHPATHQSFASQHSGHSVFDEIELHGLSQTLWPDHCVQNTSGAQLHPVVQVGHLEAIFRKGMDETVDSYSGFFDNGKRQSTGLHGFLQEKGISEIHMAGLAADFCVYYSISDALQLGYEVVLHALGTRAIDSDNYARQLKELQAHPKFRLVE